MYRLLVVPVMLLLLVGCGDGGGSNPANPANLRASAVKSHTVALTWNAQSGPLLLERKMADGAFEPLAEVTGKTSFEDFPVFDDIGYTYRLTGVNGASETTVSVPAVRPNPLTVSLTPDTARSAKKTIGTSGGSLSVTGANGVSYTLTIPPNALLRDTEITLTPINQVGGLPLSGGLLGAVRIEPEDLELYGEARLTLTATPARPAGTRPVAFASANNGQEFHLIPFGAANPLAAPRKLQDEDELAPIKPIKGGTHGVGAGTPQDVKKQTQDNPPTDPSNQSQQRAAAEEDDLAPLLTPRQLAEGKAKSLELKELNRPSRDTLAVFREFRQWLAFLRKYGLEAEFDSQIKAHSRRQANRIRTRFDELYEQCERGDRKVRREMRELLYWAKLYPALVQNLGAAWISQAEDRVKRCGIPNWEGAASASQPRGLVNGWSGSAEITYIVQDIQGDVVTYAATGRNLRLTLNSGNGCSVSVVSVEADSNPDRNVLIVDYGREPAQYSAGFFLDATYLINCGDSPVTQRNLFGILFGFDGILTLSNENRLISGSYEMTGTTYTSTWTLNAVPRTSR